MKNMKKYRKNHIFDKVTKKHKNHDFWQKPAKN